ncbi:biotin-dependent carboxyltransferase family protein [Microbacterium sp. NPDC096154]|uniref:5-oxoprolinase subunit C family protein n=1 Tax=Microbacterium sp. NPDC096154 TaxID=3155549 RepID=UPI003328F546
MMRVTMPGLQTLVQDGGRDGYYAMGMPPAGALDQRSYRVGNVLVGNASDAASLEFAFMGPAIAFTEDALVAVTGADVVVLVDGEARPGWTALRIRAGQTLSFGPMTRGSRGYIAVRGGIDVPQRLGSRSTYATIGFGGHEGRALAAGDVLPVGDQLREGTTDEEGLSLPEDRRPALESHVQLAVVPGLCNYRFTPESVERFFASTFTVSHEANRTGFRLSGPSLDFVPREPPFGAGDDPSNVVNLGYPLGSIQIPSGTEPICLLRDAVTGGGYVTFGTIVSTELDKLAQLKTPETVSFRAVSPDDARRIRAEARADLADIARTLSA